MTGTPTRSKTGQRSQRRRSRKIQRRAKWTAVALSALLLAATLLLMRMQRLPGPGGYAHPMTGAKSSSVVR